MNLRDRYKDKLFVKSEEKLIQIFSLLSAIICPLFVFIWARLDPKMPLGFIVSAWGLAAFFTLLYCFIFVSNFVKRNLCYFLYGGYYLVSSFTVCLALTNHFSEGYSLLLMLVMFYISLTFEKIRSLIYYLLTMFLLVGLAAYIEKVHSNVDDNSLILAICLMVFSVIAIFNLFVRNENKRALKESQKDYQRLLDTSPDAIIVYEQGNIVYANNAAAKIAAVDDKDKLEGKTVFEFLHPDHYELAVTSIEDVMKGNDMGYTEEKIILANNSSVDVEAANIGTTYNGKKAVMTIMRDIGARKKIEEELVEAEARYRNIVEGALVGVYFSQNHKLIYVNKYVEDTFGYSTEELYSMDPQHLVAQETRYLVAEIIQRLLSGSKDEMLEIKGVKKDGSIVYLLTHSRFIVFKGLPSIMGTIVDITERIKSEEKINQMALYDSVTSLPNRYFLNLQLKTSFERSQDGGQPVALMFIDLDRFKIINDTMGHNFGDAVLQQASLEIKKHLFESDFISRYGGDEFVVILENTWPKRAKQTAQHILEGFSNPLNVREQRIDITPSIGISFYPMDCNDAETLIKYADTAMYQAKSVGKNNYKFYKPQMNHEVSRRMQLESGLRKALQNGEFIVHYQPQIDFLTGIICGAEALIRWNHPELGMVSPKEFIPLAEETELIIPIGEWVLKTACTQNKAWQDMGLEPINMAVNVSSRQLKYKYFINIVQEILDESRLKAEYLELEITESILMDIEELKLVFDELNPMGIKLSIDDFGVGYSSLSMLQHIAINNLKIDQSFIDNIPDNPKAAAMVKTIIDIGKNLNCIIIAEGIETKRQAAFLKANNCNIGQGYLFSRPLEASDFEKLLRNWNR